MVQATEPRATPPVRALRPGGPRATRADRARSDPMAVLPAGSGHYDVVTGTGHVYAVTLPAGTCTCADSRYRGERCKHVRRVALDVAAGRTPAPDQRRATCATCGGTTFVPETDPDPVYCTDCTLAPGDLALDRETDALVVVVRTTTDRADDVAIEGLGHTVAAHPTNADYDPRDLVVEVVYPLPRSATPERVAATGVTRYAFPRCRLERVRARRD